MTIRELAAQDNATFLDQDGEPLVFCDADGIPYDVRGHFYRTGISIDPGTGLPVEDNVSAFTVSIPALLAAGIGSASRLKDESGWTVTGLDATGESVTVSVESALIDRTLGQVTIQGRTA